MTYPATTCRGCDADALQLILDLGNMPLAGGFLSGPEAIPSEKTYPLPIFVCDRCSLVQILDVVDPNVLFQDYSFSSSTVSALVDHFESYADWLVDRFSPARVIEFGCNDGVLLGPLARRGVEAWGVDVSENITELARSKGLQVVTGFFEPRTAEKLLARAGPADLVTGSNAFAHNAAPAEILAASRSVLAPSGHLCLEVMYAGDLLELMQWDTLYHEHLTFYSLGTLRVLLERSGFHVVHAERVPMHGGSLRVVAALEPAEASESASAIDDYERRTKLNDPATWRAFGSSVGRKIDIVREVFADLGHSRRIWAYGAAGKATLWLNACRMDYVEAVADASPLRAGKLMPGVHTPVVFPETMRERPPEIVFVTAWNYADGITAKEDWYRGIWATPLPELRFF